jgi:tetratricopeptide (TPR) repeat protein
MNQTTTQQLSAAEVFKRAVAAQQAGRHQQAQKLYAALLQVQPRHAAANHNVGLIYFNNGQLEAALAAFKIALTENAKEGQHWLSYAKALLEAGRADEAHYVLAQGQARGLSGPKFDALLAKVRPAYTANPDIAALRKLDKEGRHAEMEAAAREQISRFGETPVLQQWLAVALLRQGLDEQALPLLEAATRAMPQNANALNQLGLVLNHLERFDEAHETFQRALALEPGDVGILANIGDNLNDASRYAEALEWLDQAIAADQNATAARLNRINALMGLERDPEALVELRNLNATGPLSPEAANSYALLLRRAGEVDEAHRVLTALLQRVPRAIDARGTLSQVLLDKGDFDEATHQLEIALEMEPDRADIWAGSAQLRKMTPADKPWLEKAEELLKLELPLRRELPLRYSMGKFCDDIKDYEPAFAHYHRANELKKQIAQPYDGANQAALGERLRVAYSAERMRQRHPAAHESARPLFIVGMPRSGTSLTEQIIAAHPDTFGAGELVFWQHRVSQLKDAVLKGEFLAEQIDTTAAECLAELQRHSDTAVRVVDKMPGNFHWVGFIHTVFPNARILHTMRNPVDTCLSIYFQNFNTKHTYANDLDDLAHYYRLYHRLMAHWREVMPKDRFLELPYEQLVEDQEGWSRKIIEFIGLPWDERCLEFYKTDRKVGTASNWQARQPIYKTSKERWRNYEPHVGPLLPLLELYDPERGQI